MKRQPSDAYRDDLAYIHDVGHGDFARQAAPRLLELFAQAGIRDGLVVDLGCGSGIWARELVDAGYSVRGFDISPAMIAIARRRVPEGKFAAASFLDVELPPCRAITALGEVFNYAFDARNGLAVLEKFFRRAYASLAQGGLLVFDVADLKRHRRTKQVHRAGDDWAVLADFERDEAARTLTRRIVSFRLLGKCYRRSEEVHRLHLYDPPEIARLLRGAGFRVRVSRGYGDYRFWPGAAAFIARK